MTSTPLKIRDIRARAINIPMERPVRTASGDIRSAPLVLLDIDTDQDVTGRAYVFAYTPLMLRPLVSVVEEILDLMTGKPVAPVDRMADMERAFKLLGRQGLVGMALAGLDQALWDALARALGLPLAALLGGGTEPIPAYDSYGIIDPAQDRGALERSLEQGFRAIKIKLGHAGLETDVATVTAVRTIIGDGVRLMLDYNQSLDAPEAVRRIERLAEFDLEWVEEPVGAEDLVGHARVRAGVSVPIQTGENWWFPQDMAKAVAAGASDYAMLDIMKIGGVTGWLRAMGQAEAASLPVSSHAFVEASAHLLAVTPTVHWLEFLDKARPVLQLPAEVVDGAVRPRGPGLGMDWDEEAVARFAI
ncbi:MAG: enolase C-terminal domain-like protein [Methyloligellaceae bacterium]